VNKIRVCVSGEKAKVIKISQYRCCIRLHTYIYII